MGMSVPVGNGGSHDMRDSNADAVMRADYPPDMNWLCAMDGGCRAARPLQAASGDERRWLRAQMSSAGMTQVSGLIGDGM